MLDLMTQSNSSKMPSNILQNLLWFWNIKTELVFLFILFHAAMSTRLEHSLGLGEKTICSI